MLHAPRRPRLDQLLPDTYVNERAETAGRATVLSAVALVLVQARMPAKVGVGVVADAT
ncbi:hypothetical protein SY89_03194 [Halolamina pelagica]|uniref:Uncharacterized protein n=1 Tax=Halolamina pelagica TaxID=699431 RepID=A0A0P7H6G2_9EURY|nr:hypothetical protein SY89_03194 [Halolamina pelagica]